MPMVLPVAVAVAVAVPARWLGPVVVVLEVQRLLMERLMRQVLAALAVRSVLRPV